MLQTINNKLAKDEIVILRFITGEEIMGKVVESSDSEIMLNTPMAVGMTQQGIGLGPFTVTKDENDDDISFNRSVVVAYYKPQSAFVDAWKQKSSGIALPPQGIVT